jgi:hypothetical protein
MAGTESKEMRGIISASDIPYSQLRTDYSWVQNNYLPDKKLEAEQLRAEAELKEVIAMPPDAAARRERFKTSHDAYEQRNASSWAKELLRSMNSPDPLARIEKRMERTRLEYIPWEVIERALAINEKIEGISDAARSKKVSAIEKKIATIKEQRAAVMPPEAFDHHFQHSGRICIFDAFVDAWRALQGATADPVAVDGKSLKLSTPEEKNAYEALQLGLLVQPKARLRAWRQE